MPETPYTETEALIAIMEGNEAAALTLVTLMFPHERRAFSDHLETLIALAHPAAWCPGCQTFAGIGARGTIRVRQGPSWHKSCYDRAVATGER